MLGLGGLGLAGALTAAALAAPSRATATAATYVPGDPAHVVARVPARDPAEVAARRALAAAPDVEVAVALARADIARYRKLSDPRYLGRAQATLGPWWSVAAPPAEVRLLRATIRQSLHDFPGARADLDQLVVEDPRGAQAHLTRAVVATVTADYAAARESCAAAGALTGALVAAACEAPLDGIAGRAHAASERLTQVLASARGADREIRGWALTALAELAVMRGAPADAERHLRGALGLDASDAYARDLLADVLLVAGRPAEASALLAGRDAVDSHLVRRAIAEHQRGGPEAASLIAAMRERIAAAAARNDAIHLREEARFALAIDGDAARAVALATRNWAVQKELADARLLAEAAHAARLPAAAAPVRAWIAAHGVRDAQLARWLPEAA